MIVVRNILIWEGVKKLRVWFVVMNRLLVISRLVEDLISVVMLVRM